MAFQLLRGGALEELRPTGTTDLRCGSVERFPVFKGSASYRMELDGRAIERGKPVISGLALKRPGLVASRGTTNVRKLEEALLVSPYLADPAHGTDLLGRSPNEKIGKIGGRTNGDRIGQLRFLCFEHVSWIRPQAGLRPAKSPRYVPDRRATTLASPGHVKRRARGDSGSRYPGRDAARSAASSSRRCASPLRILRTECIDLHARRHYTAPLSPSRSHP